MLLVDKVERVLVAAILAADFAILALLSEMVTDVLAGQRVPTLVGARADVVPAPGVTGKVVLDSLHLADPFAPLLVVRAVHLERVHSLLEMNIAEVVEILRLTRRAGVVDRYAFLDAWLAVVTATAHHLSGVSQDLGADLAYQFLRDLAHEVEGGLTVVFGRFRQGVVHGDDLKGERVW